MKAHRYFFSCLRNKIILEIKTLTTTPPPSLSDCLSSPDLARPRRGCARWCGRSPGSPPTTSACPRHQAPALSRVSRCHDVTTAVVLSQRAPTENYRHGHSAHATPGRPSPSLVHHLHDQASCAIVHGSNDECCITIPVSADLLCPRYQTELVSAGQQPPHTCSVVVERPGAWLRLRHIFRVSHGRSSTAPAHSKHIIISSYRHIVISPVARRRSGGWEHCKQSLTGDPARQ